MSSALAWLFDGIGTAALATLSGLGARAAVQHWRPRRSRRSRTTVYTAGAESHMADYRARLDKVIISARHNVYISGPGFDSSPNGEKQALTYAAALRSSLQRDVRVVRVQTTPIVTEFWLDHLKELVREFPALFELWVFLDPPTLPLAGMCAVDVDDVAHSVTEFVIQMPRQLGTHRADIASTAVFIEGHPVLARAVRDQIIEFTTDPQRVRRVTSAEAAEGFFRGEYYFAYDSYMNRGQATTRLPSAVLIGPAVLRDYELVFDRTGSFRPGGVANIRPAPGNRVYGVLWRISPADLHNLDGMQDPRSYSRHPLTVYSLTGKRFSGCHTYSAVPDRPDGDPDIEHLNSLIEAARDAGLPTEYVTELEGRRPDLTAGKTTEQLVREAFGAAGRKLRQGSQPQLLEPGPVWISATQVPSSEEIERFERALPSGESGYFVHVGDLPRNVSVYIDGMRVGGKKVITVSIRALQAALAAGEATAFLDELEQNYGNRDNLFDTKNALIDDRFLFGRDALLTRIGSAIGRDEHVLISGLRKAGKTSLLNILRQHLVSYPVCLIDLQRFDRNAEDWPPTLFTMMVKAVDRWGRIGRTEWPFKSPAPATATELAGELNQRFAYLGTEPAKRRVVVMLDEIERVFPRRSEADATRRWVRAAGALRALAQDGNRSVVVIGADLRPTVNRENDLGNGETNPFFSFFQEIPVALLDHNATGDMLESLASAMGVKTVDKAFVDQIFAMTGGHPSLARTIAAEAYRGRQNPGRLDVADLENGVATLHDTDRIGSFIRNNLWQPMTPAEKKILSDLSRRRIARRQRSDVAFVEGYASLRSQGIISDSAIRVGVLRQWARDHGEAGES